MEIIQGITGQMFGTKARGVNMKHPVEIRSIYVRSKTDHEGFSTLSFADEKDGIMLQIKVSEDVKALLRTILEVKDNGKE